MIISIDGPAGSGKSTVAKLLANRLGFIHFNSGSLYRGITAHLLHTGIKDVVAYADLNLSTKIVDGIQHVYVNDIDYTDHLRDNEVSVASPSISINPTIRDIVDNCQRTFCNNYNCVIEGRDIGSFVFPNADYKFYLDCSIEERARRRYKEEKKKNNKITLAQIEQELKSRDRLDQSKPIAPLVVPKNAIVIDSSHLSVEEVVDKMYSHVR